MPLRVNLQKRWHNPHISSMTSVAWTTHQSLTSPLTLSEQLHPLLLGTQHMTQKGRASTGPGPFKLQNILLYRSSRCPLITETSNGTQPTVIVNQNQNMPTTSL
jgi:hypothetical protein